jgi:hypothetical protein
MQTQDPDFAAMKDLARLKYLLNFEAIATAGNDDDANEAGATLPD